MALDEALLDDVAESPMSAIFRTYGWTVPTLSLGYFQSIAEVEADPRWRGVPLVRRPTGGGALWHHHEITYALVVPRSDPRAHPSQALYRAVHTAIADVIRSQGLEADRRGEGGPGGMTRPFLCFTDRDAEDIVSSGAKLVGSAQRRRAGAVLQHGSLLLARSSITPDLPGAANLGRVSPDILFWSSLLRVQVPQALGFQIEETPVSSRALELAAELEEEVYRCQSWIRRR